MIQIQTFADCDFLIICEVLISKTPLITFEKQNPKDATIVQKRLILLTFFVTVFIAIGATGTTAQTRDELKQKYGAPDAKGHYVVRPGIGLSVKYDRNQNLSHSQMIIEPLDSNTLKAMPSDMAREILDELIPVGKRIKKEHGADFFLLLGCRTDEITEFEQFMIGILKRCKEQGGGIYSINISVEN